MRAPFVAVCCLALLAAVARGAEPGAAAPRPRPNILWFVVDDMSADFACYGQSLVATPHVDRLAAEGTRFRHAFVTAPVCSPCRSALVTGMYQTTIGAHHHRSGRGVLRIDLPAAVRPLPAILHDAGYWTAIGEGLGGDTPAARRLGKTDYNFRWDESIYDASDWGGRAAGQPFFMQVTLPGGKLRGQGGEATTKLAARARERFGSAVDPAAVTLPPYYPRDPVLLADQAAYLDAVRFTDDHVGQVLARLGREGLLESTLVVFMTDHGISHARGKQFLYDEGTHVPLVVRGPGIPRGAVRDDLVEQIDLAALSLAAAGLDVPEWMQGRDLFAAGYRPRAAVFAARDRCDETVDRLRSVRTPTHLYIRNFLPRRPALQPNAYKDDKAIVQRLRALHAAGGLDPLAERLLFAPERPLEELYAWRTDRHQLENLAADPAHAAVLGEMRTRLADWQAATRDPGPEPEAMVDSDMAVYLEESKGGRRPEIERTIALMKEWAAAGR